MRRPGKTENGKGGWEHQLTAAFVWWCGPRPCLGWVEMAVDLREGPRYLGHSFCTSATSRKIRLCFKMTIEQTLQFFFVLCGLM